MDAIKILEAKLPELNVDVNRTLIMSLIGDGIYQERYFLCKSNRAWKKSLSVSELTCGLHFNIVFVIRYWIFEFIFSQE